MKSTGFSVKELIKSPTPFLHLTVEDKDKENNNPDGEEEWQKYQTMFKYVEKIIVKLCPLNRWEDTNQSITSE